MAIVIHVPKPVLGGYETLCEESIVLARGPYVGNTPTIANDIHGLAEPGGSNRRRYIRQRGLEVLKSQAFDMSLLPFPCCWILSPVYTIWRGPVGAALAAI